MNKSPLISVVMPVYNESIHDLHDSINSILNQTYKNFEYIIIDDNPNSKVIKRYLLKQAKTDSRVRLIFNRIKNLGVARSSNKGIKIAKGEFIDRMDADDIARSNKLQIQLNFIIKYKLDLTCSNFSIMNSNDEITREYGYISSTVVNECKIKRIFSHCNIAMGPTLFFKKRSFNDVGGYRNINVEDYDLVARFLIQGYKVGYQNVPLLNKRLRKSSISYRTIFNQYIIIKSISTFLYNTHFRKTLPLKNIRNNIINVTNKGKNKFNKFIRIRYSFNNKRSIENVICLLLAIVSSITVIKWCIWSIKNKIYQ